ncbi:hypothetical protein DH2020_014779 [Rehmannia glutinosa]|uniref:Protein kinase domain-containing protein n=1 Tax=Rehmannia glutinosa TaxID=99300 RepID=A0ABR0X0Q7_REHGL
MDNNPYAFIIDELLNDDHSHNCFENNNQYDELLNDDHSYQSRYMLLNVISKGSYGIVYRAQDMNTGEIVAIKHEFHGLSRPTLREVRTLKSLPRHPSIVQFKDTIVEDRDRIFVVMEYIENDLERLMNVENSHPFTLSEVKCLMKQLLEGLTFLHENGVMHRDLKPSNILINQVRGQLKICDFGLSRYFGKASGSYTPGLVTLWYRAPELLLGAKEYSCAIDMWSVSCIMAELLLKEVFFRENSEIQQLKSIYMLLGTPDHHDITCLGFSSTFHSAKRPYHELRLKFATATYFNGAQLLTECGFDLLEKLLTHDLLKRITARATLHHDWFKEYYRFLNLTDLE